MIIGVLIAIVETTQEVYVYMISGDRCEGMVSIDSVTFRWSVVTVSICAHKGHDISL